MIASALLHPLLWGTTLLLCGKSALWGVLVPNERWLLGLSGMNIAAGYGSFLLLGWRCLPPRDRAGYWKTALLTVPYWLLMSVAAYRAIGQLVWRPHYCGLMYQEHQDWGCELSLSFANDVQSSPIQFLRWAGRRVMMDFGFGTFLDKFEKRFGGGVTTGLLVLIGLAVASFSINLVATFIVIPTISLIYDVVASDRFGSYQALKTIQVLLNIFFFVVAFALFGDYAFDKPTTLT